MIRRFLSSIIATIIFSIILSLIITEGRSLAFTFMIIQFSVLAFLIGGIPSSFIIDKLVHQRYYNAKISVYIVKFIFYGIAGIVIGLILYFILLILENEMYLFGTYALQYLLYGLLAALIFYHCDLILKLIINNKK